MREYSTYARLDGCAVTLSRSAHDGRLVIEIDTSEMGGDDVHDEHHNVPKLVVYVNDERSEVSPSGGWEVSRG